jgi:hypothetical protein
MGGLVLSLSACHEGSRAAAGSARAGDSIATGARAEAAAPAVGRVATYRLELESRATYGGGAELALSLTSNLELRRLAGAAVVLDLRLEDVHFAQPEAAPELAQVTSELERGAVLELEHGKLQTIRVEGTASPLASSVLRSVAEALELPAPADTSGKSWTAQTADAAGTYELELSALGAGKFSKKKLRYEPRQVAAQTGAPLHLELAPRVLESDGSVELGESGIVSSSYEERLEMGLSLGATASAHNRVSLKLLKSAPAGVAPQRGVTAPLSQEAPTATAVDHDAVDRAKIGTFTFESVLAALVAAERDAAPVVTDAERQLSTPEENAQRERRLNEQNRAFSALTALLRQKPELLGRTVTLIRAGKPAPRLLLDALAACDTPAAKTALVALVNEPKLSADLREAAAHDLSRVETPSVETVETLTSLLEKPQLGLIALYGLGTQARHLRDRGQSDAAERIGQLLTEQLGRATDTEHRVHVLRAIANSGLSSLLRMVKPLIDSPSEAERGAAIEALRLMDAPEVDGVIAARLAGEPSAFVRRAVLGAVKPRKPTAELKLAVATAAEHDKDDHDRYAAIALLVNWLPQDASLREPLARIADRDAVPALRDAARAAL